MRRPVGALALALLLSVAAPVLAQVDHLEVLQTPQLVSCDPRPFFRISVSPVDAERRPVGVSLGSGDARKLFQLSDSGRIHPVVYVGTPGSSGTTRG